MAKPCNAKELEIFHGGQDRIYLSTQPTSSPFRVILEVPTMYITFKGYVCCMRDYIPDILQYLQFRYLKWPLLNFTLTNFVKRVWNPHEKRRNMRIYELQLVCVDVQAS